MRYKLDKTMELRLSGEILNCVNNTLLDPMRFIITSRLINIKSGKSQVVKCRKNDELVEFSLPPNTLDEGSYEWRIYLRNELVSWATPITIVEVY